MIENFPSPHLTDNNWTDIIKYYLNDLPLKIKSPQIVIVNANTDNRGVMSSYQEMRFGLTSTLLGDGYYSFDSGDQSHAQTWWYDEYDTDLGAPVGGAISLAGYDNFKSDVWKREYENGLAVVNTTSKITKS